MASAEPEAEQVQDANLRNSRLSSPSIKVNSVSASTDSMVTVRLSQPFPDLSPTAAQEIDPSAFDSDVSAESMPEAQGQESDTISNESVFSDQGDTEVFPRYSSQFHGSGADSDKNSFPTHYTSSHFPPTIAEDEEYDNNVEANPWRPRSGSSGSDSGGVDWAGLEKTEQEEARDEASDESTAFLLARLEQENNALATDPRFGLRNNRPRKQSRPPSMQVLKKLVQDPSTTRSSRYSVVPNPPPMTELEFWAALVKDYPQTAQRLPTLTANKIKSGVPPPLRGVVWVSMVGARDRDLEEQFDKLLLETSPYENLIGKDIGRSFPGVEMFREADGEGQQMLARVLKCFSLYDKEIGYCQGLGFLVGPLLMQMGDKDAFCVLVKLMENYDLRSCFLPDLSGLHLRIYQFKHLLDQHMPVLAAHLASLQVEAAYLSQWFLSFFAVTCPLPMLFRIYDVIFAEGASETIMRVALSLMKRNSERIMASHEFEEVMHLLLSRSLWEPYACNADDLVNDFGEMNSIVTRESLKALENSFKHAHVNDPGTWYAFLPDATAAASRFLGRLWTSHTPAKSNGGLTPGQANGSLSRPQSFLRRSPSKQSIAASVNSTDVSSEGTNSVGTVTTDATVVSRESSADISAFTPKPDSITGPGQSTQSRGERDLHGQIEDLLTALSEMQRDNSLLTAQLQREREERIEDHQTFETLLGSLGRENTTKEETEARRRTVQYFTSQIPSDVKEDRRKTTPIPLPTKSTQPMSAAALQDLIQHANDRIKAHKDAHQQRSSQTFETKQRLQESLTRTREQLRIETARSESLVQQLEDQTKQTEQVQDDLRQTQARLQEKIKEKENLEKTIQDLTEVPSRSASIAWSDTDSPPLLLRTDTGGSSTSIGGLDRRDSVSAGTSPITPSEMRPGRSESLLTKALTNGQLNPSSSSLPQRTSSLATQGVLSTQGHTPASEDDLLVELVNVKTSEAVARQELEEVKAKLDAMRRMLGVESPPSIPQPSMLHRPSPSESTVVGTSPSGGVLSSAASFFSAVKPSTSPGPTATPKETKTNSPSTTTPSSAGTSASSTGLAGSFWGWAKKSTTTTPVPTSSAEVTEEQATADAQALV